MEEKYINLKELKTKYIKDSLSSRELAKFYNVGKTTILRKMKNAGIKPREQWIFKKYKDKEWLEIAATKYTYRKMAALCKCCVNTIMRWTKRYNIKYKRKYTKEFSKNRSRITSKFRIGKKHSEKTKEKMRLSQLGEKGHNWMGGKIPLRNRSPWKQQKQKTLKRDNYICQLCGKTKKENDNRELDVHHRVPFRYFKNYKDAHDLNNLITLCRKCHQIEERKIEINNIKIGKNPKVWHYVNLFNSDFGDNVSIGSFTEIGGSIVGNNCSFQAHCFIPSGVKIGNNVFFAPRVTCTNDLYPPSYGKHWKETIIKDNAVIGAGSVILPGVIIGKNSVIGAGSVVTKNIPDGEVWFGNPARFYKNREEVYKD